MERVLEGTPVGRALLWRKVASAVAAGGGGHYPAPAAIVAAVRAGVERGRKEGLAVERAEFARLGLTPESAALRGLFFAQTSAKRNPFGAEAGAAGPLSTIGVLGAGLMGAGIAQVAAAAGLRVVLKDRDAAALSRGEGQVATALQGSVRRGKLTKFEADSTLSRLIMVHDGMPVWRKHMAGAGVVIEAVPESLPIKHAVLAEVGPVLGGAAVWASNTSALPIAAIAKPAGTLAPRVLGMHFFSPVDKMPLVEIIPHADTSKSALSTAFDLALRMGKTPILVKDVPGFFVNRVLTPWASEALLMVQQGLDPATLDAAVRGFGYPVGPVTLADEVGVDVLTHTLRTMRPVLGEERGGGADMAWLAALLEAGLLGRKTGKGFFLYPPPAGGKGGKGGKADKSGKGAPAKTLNPAALALLPARTTTAANLSPPAIMDRLMLRFLKEAVHALEDGIISCPGDGDIGAVFGLGFPPFLGGPFRWMDARGHAAVVAAMDTASASLGARFAAPASLRESAKRGGKYYSS